MRCNRLTSVLVYHPFQQLPCELVDEIFQMNNHDEENSFHNNIFGLMQPYTRVDDICVMHIIVPKLCYLSFHCYGQHQLGQKSKSVRPALFK